MPDNQRSRRILLCGIGPLPVSNPDRLYAPGLRVWGFARAILAAGCTVDLLEVRFGKDTVAGTGARFHRLRLDTAKIETTTEDLPSAPPPELVARVLAASSYDAMVSTTDVMNDACALQKGDIPFWCDFNGHPMAERQSLAACYGSDEGIADQWDMILPSLLRGDRFSTCSDAERLALIGELGACGRLNRLTDGCDGVVSLPPAAVFAEFLTSTRNVLRPHIVPNDAFVVLWTGGYNTWSDPDTLAKGLVDAMQRESRIHYVSTGGAIEGHDDRTFARFKAAIESSSVRDRCHFVGWVATQDVSAYYRESDVAVNCDRRTLDGELGFRNRILDWVSAGLPVVTTDLCELTHDLSGRGLIDTFEIGDAQGLADCLVRLAHGQREALRERAARGREYILDRHCPERIYASLVAWVCAPERAPDLVASGARISGVPFAFPDNPLARRRAAEWLSMRMKKTISKGLVGRMKRFFARFES